MDSRIFLGAFALLSLTGAAGCGASSPARAGGAAPAPPPAAAPGGAWTGAAAFAGPVQTGRASYYADSLAGRPTASGEPYDPRAMTAAHRTLSFGTIVDVVRTDGRHVVVRINDRGPFGRADRIIDLSRSAAEAIGMIRAGVVDVRLQVLQAGPPRRR